MNNNIDTENLFEISSEYLNNILKDEELLHELKSSCENEKLKLINKSVSYVLYDQNELFKNSYKAEINIQCESENIAYYVLYLDKDKNFIDEFFVIN
ncbi:hypothetical protein [Chryseobacterium sp. NKUCC03_KSP]|jgi:hypothetical protein|uniref:hypothetical protein n=1 Tax=Chryseobacterium sp. NKUCC03_KSP TaxID=2842125 RepID=UPI001C5AF9C3|nr:hypothetical protein [Chryseobacterium sp. NKUCC03_KSP]MBW3524899.1 hypothetical protein [Chryseobacterium sp. NKUCC03_KSP]